jgi:hypothetical protein
MTEPRAICGDPIEGRDQLTCRLVGIEHREDTASGRRFPVKTYAHDACWAERYGPSQAEADD